MDGHIVVRVKDGLAGVSNPRPVAAGKAKMGSSGHTYEEPVVSNALYEATTFTLDQRSTVYISGTGYGPNSRRWLTFDFVIPVAGGSYQSQEEYFTGMSDFQRDDTRDNFEVVTLDPGEYTLYVRVSTSGMDNIQYWVNVIIGSNTENSTMAFVTGT